MEEGRGEREERERERKKKGRRVGREREDGGGGKTERKGGRERDKREEEGKGKKERLIITLSCTELVPSAYLSMLTTFKRKANETRTKVSRSAIGLLTRLRAGRSPLSIK